MPQNLLVESQHSQLVTRHLKEALTKMIAIFRSRHQFSPLSSAQHCTALPVGGDPYLSILGRFYGLGKTQDSADDTVLNFNDSLFGIRPNLTTEI